MPIASLRRALPELPQEVFDEYLLRMERNELVHLLSVDDPSALSEEDRRSSVVGPNGSLRSFLIYLDERPRPSILWD